MYFVENGRVEILLEMNLPGTTGTLHQFYDFADLRPSAPRRLDLRSASDARVTKTAYAVHEMTRKGGFPYFVSPRGLFRAPL